VDLSELVFGIPLLLGAVIVACSVLGVGHAELDGHVDVHDLSEGHADADGSDSDTDGNGLWFALLGFGRVPLMIIVMFLLLTFGVVGFGLSGPVTALLGEPRSLFVTVPVAGLFSLVSTIAATRLLALVMPRTETYATKPHELLGLTGTVLVRLDAREVVARVLDIHDTELRLHCAVDEPVDVGDRIELISMDEHNGHYAARKLT